VEERPVVCASLHVELEQASFVGVRPRLTVSAPYVFIMLLSELKCFKGACLDCHVQ